ncbi:hypothetical protein QWZ14_28610 [Paeniroseomonas aquatica]|uniref:Uncharacterized protein n=1 Tax=Paeniroseomonas aquatica TaxID=373043 RepID=A0ABT8AFA6_9PROT|nr:hypothetical protein [Paeniroseomonas aquatica]MDN3568360.1 hypothetical protein [Paeniroseomonas aquatica]
MSAAPVLAALLARAFPGLAARDLSLPHGRLLPWLPGTRAGLAAPVPAAEAALLARFRQAGRPLLGLDPEADLAADPAWDAAPERLAWRERPGPADGATLTLLQGGSGEMPAHPGQARIMLLFGRNAAPERHVLLLAEARLAEVFGRLRDAAAGLAGIGWQVGGRLVSPRLASLGALAPEGAVRRMAVPAAGLPSDLADPATLGGTRQARLLLGALPPQPWQLRLGFAGAAPGPLAFFLDGRRHPAGLTQATTSGEAGGTLSVRLAAPTGQAQVLGLAWPGAAPAGLRLTLLELEG